MVSKILAMGLVLIMALGWSSAFASYTSNASPIVTNVSNSVASRGITFPYTTVNLDIYNMGSTGNIWVDLFNGANKNSDLGKCVLIKAGNEISLYDFHTDGITIFWANQFPTASEASPIVVIPSY